MTRQPARRSVPAVDPASRPSRRGWPPPGEAALATGFAGIGVLLTVSIVSEGAVAVVAVAVALTVIHSAALAWRRRSPELVLAVMGATAVVAVAVGWPVVIFGPAVLAGLHGLGATRPRERGLPVLAATVVVMALAVFASDADASTVFGNAIAFGVAWWLGDRQRQAGERVTQAVRDSEERARRAVAGERLRIARELHDVVAHALSVIAVQAGTGRVLLDSDPATARSALASIEGESRAALDEMRRLLEVLRADGDAAAGSEPLAPSPGLDDLESLVAATVRSGLPVEVRIEGERGPLPAGAELAAYRIVQEALTNVRRHAAATRAEVRVAWNPGAIDVEVLDDGGGRSTSGARAGGGAAGLLGGTGHGLVGMRERAALYGGSLEAGELPGGGFRVAAHIPCGLSASGDAT